MLVNKKPLVTHLSAFMLRWVLVTIIEQVVDHSNSLKRGLTAGAMEKKNKKQLLTKELKGFSIKFEL